MDNSVFDNIMDENQFLEDIIVKMVKQGLEWIETDSENFENWIDTNNYKMIGEIERIGFYENEVNYVIETRFYNRKRKKVVVKFVIFSKNC